jgi:hypothetical protein
MVLVSVAQAEEKSCNVKGMHCEACTDMVKDRVCNDQFSVCDVTVKSDGKSKDKKAKIGVMHLKTKDAAGKIDEAVIAKAIADTDYKLDKCTPVKSQM